MQLSWCLEEKLARSTSFWRHKRSVHRRINPVIWDIIAIWDCVPKGCTIHISTKEQSCSARWVSTIHEHSGLSSLFHIHVVCASYGNKKCLMKTTAPELNKNSGHLVPYGSQIYIYPQCIEEAGPYCFVMYTEIIPNKY